MFSKNTQILMKIPSMGAELFHVDGQTDRQTHGKTERQAGRYDEANNLFLQFHEHP
jgi:hypothetical protein